MVKTNIDLHKVLDNFHLKHFHIEEMMSYINSQPQDEFGQTAINQAARNGFTDYVKILAPLIGNPNTPDKYGCTPIYWAAWNGYTEIIKILAPLTNNPNAPNAFGITPSATAKSAEIRRILKSFSTSRKCN